MTFSRTAPTQRFRHQRTPEALPKLAEAQAQKPAPKIAEKPAEQARPSERLRLRPHSSPRLWFNPKQSEYFKGGWPEMEGRRFLRRNPLGNLAYEYVFSPSATPDTISYYGEVAAHIKPQSLLNSMTEVEVIGGCPEIFSRPYEFESGLCTLAGGMVCLGSDAYTNAFLEALTYADTNNQIFVGLSLVAEIFFTNRYTEIYDRHFQIAPGRTTLQLKALLATVERTARFATYATGLQAKPAESILSALHEYGTANHSIQTHWPQAAEKAGRLFTDLRNFQTQYYAHHAKNTG